MELSSPQGITLSNTESVPGKRIVQFFGVVTGNTVRAKHIGRDIMAGLKNVVGGELKGYTELLQDSRQEATERMAAQARSMGANAVINVRFATSSISQGAAELFAYGTAVKVE
ncbi:MAG: YbjQ family protein [Woeseiaceae bacterium]|nr:YbjQ family protein [Woeseiaceae bacterium]